MACVNNYARCSAVPAHYDVLGTWTNPQKLAARTRCFELFGAMPVAAILLSIKAQRPERR